MMEKDSKFGIPIGGRKVMTPDASGPMTVNVNGKTIVVDTPAVMPDRYCIVINDTHTRAWIEEVL